MAPPSQPSGTPAFCVGALPPSTMAALLINNLSAKRPSRQPNHAHHEHDDLQLLMSEVSTTENDLSSLETECDLLKHKHKLIYVIAKVILEKLSQKNDLFTNPQTVIEQACEALDVFISTIKDFPAILEYKVNGEGYEDGEVRLKSRGKEMLWIWLFPRILPFVGRRKCGLLTAKINTFFEVAFEVVGKSPRLWRLSSGFFCYLKDCVSTILHNMQNVNLFSQTSPLNIVLPTEHFDPSIYCHDSEQALNRSGASCSYILNDLADTLPHAIYILSIMTDVSIQAASFQDATPAFQDYLAWMVDSFYFIYETQKVWTTSITLNQLEDTSSPTVTIFGVVHRLLSSIRTVLSDSLIRKGYTYLAIIAADLVSVPSDLIDKDVNLKFCQALLYLTTVCRNHDTVCRITQPHLIPKLMAALDDDDASVIVGNDVHNAAEALKWACQPEANQTDRPELPHATFETDSLNAEFNLLVLGTIEPRAEQGAPPTKRRKVETRGLFEEITSKLYSLLGAQEATDLSGLDRLAVDCFARLEDSERYSAMELLSMIPCAAHGSLVVNRDASGVIIDTRCYLCEKASPNTAMLLDNDRCQTVGQIAISSLTNLIDSQAFAESKRSRVLAMVALKRFAIHFTDEQFFDLNLSPLGQWCLKSLHSSVRELRIAAGRALPEFLQGSQVSQSLLLKNRNGAINFLRDVCEAPAAKLSLQETCVLAWGQIARALEDGQLNLVLLKLVEYLGHQNPIVSNAAYNEILTFANLYGGAEKPVERVFSPFWGSIAIAAVKTLLVRPQTTQLMADLLEITVPAFLILTQAYTLPWLVLWGEAKIIKKIAQARDEEVWRVCIDSSNIVHIMALLLVQTVSDIEQHTMSAFKVVSSDFEKLGVDFAYLLRMDPSSTFLHLLKAAGDADDSKKSRIRKALQFLVECVQNEEMTRKGKPPMAAFLQQHNLGLVTRISEVVNDTAGREQQPTFEKKRNVRAIEEMVRIGKTYTRTARPQICACLQSALSQKALQSSAFSAWSAMLHCLGDEDVETMLESTFSTVIQHWELFDEQTKEVAVKLIDYLLRERARCIRNKIADLPSLSQFPQLAQVESKLNDLRKPTDISNTFQIFSRRMRHENAGVVSQALYELREVLHTQQSYLQASAVSEQPDVVIGRLMRSIMDACVKFSESHHDIAELSGECIGLIGCLDPNRVEAVREQADMVVVENFEDTNETTDFVLFLLEEVIVNAFLSATDTALQGFLSFVMQDLLEKGGFKDVCAPILASEKKKTSDDVLWRKWSLLPDHVQDTLTPFLTSMFSIKDMKVQSTSYPIFRPDSSGNDRTISYNSWLKVFVLDLLQRPKNVNTALIFDPLCRAIRVKDLSVANFLLPYLILHIIILGTDEERQNITAELLCVLKYKVTARSRIKHEELRLCSEAVFRILDYLSRWIQAIQPRLNNLRGQDHDKTKENIQKVKKVVESIPAEIVSDRAIQCKSYSRALFYWEQHIRNTRTRRRKSGVDTQDMERLQEIYTQIDEPDGIEGISAHLHVLDIDQIILGHRKAGRWTAAQGWYEIKLAEDPEDVDVQINLLTCLKESGQHDVLLNYIEGMHTATETVGKLVPFATEASWATNRWNALQKYTSIANTEAGEDFNVSIGKALLSLYQKDHIEFDSSIRNLRTQIACSLSRSTTSSIGSFHDPMLKLHVLTELEMIAGTNWAQHLDRQELLESLDRRLETIGGYLNDKQYLLGIRRAAMQLSSLQFTKGELASVWLTNARLARKGNAIHQSFNAVLHASQLGDDSAKIEHARLLWKEDQHRKAIQSLQGAIDSNAFISHNKIINDVELHEEQKNNQNLLEARAHLLLAKWLDIAGQTNSNAVRAKYQQATRLHAGWEKSHYCLGRHYNKILESQKNLAPDVQAENFITGENAYLVILSYMRALQFGAKYVYQTLPSIITLWLDLGTQVYQKVDPKYGNSQDFVDRVTKSREEWLKKIHAQWERRLNKMPAYIFYTALPQIVSRITHPHKDVNKSLQGIIYKVVVIHPQHSLWSLLAISTSTQIDRRQKGIDLLRELSRSKPRNDARTSDISMKALIRSGQELASELLKVCEAGDFSGQRVHRASITKDLQFRHKVTPCLLAMPVESVLTATLPTVTNKVLTHQAFSREVVTIQSFEDDVLILNSIAKPRRLTAMGSNGQLYHLLCKPKDDLRKDQRLMEFNSMINRSLKRDAESSRRQLYIRTYAVTPLNEECGIIEWVDGLKTFRDILLSMYKPLGISVQFGELAKICSEAANCDAAKCDQVFSDVISGFPPVFHLWFVAQFPEPSAWFAARLRYTRSCAVMSMVGTILGLGDRHTENILFEEGNGGTFHVDFNCLFDKGLTFACPEKVPFRLTHNMVDAMGMYGYEGPFRKSAELTLRLLRQQKETLMTILEAFVYDPTLDLMGKRDKKKREKEKEKNDDGVQSAHEVLRQIDRKVEGLLKGESVPLSVEGHVDELITQATNKMNLASMYIGWCAFY